MDRHEVRLHRAQPAGVADLGAVPSAGGEHFRVPRALCALGQHLPTPPSKRRRIAGAHQGHPY